MGGPPAALQRRYQGIVHDKHGLRRPTIALLVWHIDDRPNRSHQPRAKWTWHHTREEALALAAEKERASEDQAAWSVVDISVKPRQRLPLIKELLRRTRIESIPYTWNPEEP